MITVLLGNSGFGKMTSGLINYIWAERHCRWTVNTWWDVTLWAP